MISVKLQPGTILTLQFMRSKLVYFNNRLLGRTYVLDGDPFEITVSGIVGQDIFTAEGERYNLTPKRDDDFYAVVEE